MVWKFAKKDNNLKLPAGKKIKRSIKKMMVHKKLKFYEGGILIILKFVEIYPAKNSYFVFLKYVL